MKITKTCEAYLNSQLKGLSVSVNCAAGRLERFVSRSLNPTSAMMVTPGMMVNKNSVLSWSGQAKRNSVAKTGPIAAPKWSMAREIQTHALASRAGVESAIKASLGVGTHPFADAVAQADRQKLCRMSHQPHQRTGLRGQRIADYDKRFSPASRS